MKGAKKILKRGLVHLYTGRGKGKTTAALGLAMRAAGAGLKVCIFQFLKGGGRESSEVRSCGYVRPRIKVVRFEQVHPCFSKERRREHWRELKQSVNKALDEALQAICRGGYDLVVLDEIVNTLHCGLVEAGKLLDLIRDRPAGVELILTGRGAGPKLKRVCDYVTEMRLVKHPYERGVACRKGIEF